MDRERVLFLCTGNTSRSQMAEAILRHRAGDRLDVHSAGLAPGAVRPETITVLEELAIPIVGLRSKGVDEYLGKVHISHMITVCADADANCPRIWPMAGQRIHWSVDDPAVVEGPEEERLAAYRRARDELSDLIDCWLAEIARSR